ncbi:hypothetical protein MPL1032_20449 [Mesorhizobium plurifarium]|uniref:Uncharacterized protein n=1 Tax=Mesorhizobium plurifarium TaxID=69974 RepID=A0A0K2VWW2_MESPL|nr:hypothetical protein MPL1032_20449 [Mesorhizobium plurifarium]
MVHPWRLTTYTVRFIFRTPYIVRLTKTRGEHHVGHSHRLNCAFLPSFRLAHRRCGRVRHRAGVRACPGR